MTRLAGVFLGGNTADQATTPGWDDGPPVPVLLKLDPVPLEIAEANVAGLAQQASDAEAAGVGPWTAPVVVIDGERTCALMRIEIAAQGTAATLASEECVVVLSGQAMTTKVACSIIPLLLVRVRT